MVLDTNTLPNTQKHSFSDKTAVLMASNGTLGEIPAVVVVMVPLPAQGHLNQFLNIARLLSAREVPVHYIGSATHNRQAKHRVHGWEPSVISNIQFHDFHLPPFITPSPDPCALNKFPAHFQSVFDSTVNLSKPLAALLQTLSTKARRVVVLHDSAMCFTAKEACSIPNGEAYSFHPVSAFAVLFFILERLSKSTIGDILIPDDLPDLTFEDCFSDSFAKFIHDQYDYAHFDAGDLYNTCRPIEGRFIDLLSQEKLLGNKKQWAIGPLNPISLHVDSKSRRHNCLEWLDKQPKNSVLYVSFGTMTSISDEQIIALALGLEFSKQRFVWALREADKGDIFAEEKESRKFMLPDYYEERVKGTGMIVRDWAPQLEILAHPSTGGFLSHCGWNSCMESLSMGVPIAAWPMHSDQPRNTMLVTEVLKVGLVVRDWAQRKEIVVPSSTIKTAVNKLMVSEEGEQMRRRAKELGVDIQKEMSDGGTSVKELESFINHISRR
ncbi:Zeatin o-glucosyltransferase [Thalictrum thalictroides]|uniref:Glycosyltransferase n=1 Tax=Thalictrum thalictroides TaxID=46969 RepID=A0A7J6UUH1_THATH|nr:Zeatin o-glucosyltransferase [Thalictrum thalictroides]